MNNIPIEVNKFIMRFGQNEVIKNISFKITGGQSVGLLGSNGSGKTTIIRSLLGIYQPTAGTLLINDAPYKVSSMVKVGYLPEERGLYKKETVIDTMIYFGQLKGMNKDQAKQWSLEYLKRVDLVDKTKEKISKLSGGQQQKIQLAITIMNKPQVLILDEPTKGLDPLNRKLLNDIIEEYRNAGATIVLVTHQMEEVEKLCDSLLLIKDGSIVLQGSVSDIRNQYNGKSLDDIYVEIYEKDNKIVNKLMSNKNA